MESMDLAAKRQQLDRVLQRCGSLIVAYSGGTDSAFLAFAAQQALGSEHMLAVIADSPSLPRKELEAALAFAATHGIPTRVLLTGEMDRPDYQRNDSQRCFFCKDELFASMESLRGQLGFEHLAFGMNTDDRGDHRPGQIAAGNYRVLAPLVEADLSKAEIRHLAQDHGLTLHDKPASACLASRLAYGLPVTSERLAQVEQAEEYLHGLGFTRVRVRHHDTLARIEFDQQDLPRALHPEILRQVSHALKSYGFTFVSVDAEGYRSGSMNALLPAASLVSAPSPVSSSAQTGKAERAQ